MIYSNPHSHNKIMHADNCHYVKNKKMHARTFANPKEGFSQGYRFCKKCNPLLYKWQQESRRALAYAKKYGLELVFGENCLRVVCGNERWKIVINETGRTVSLYHQNSFTSYEENYIPHYHKQNVSHHSILRLLEYIYQHYLYRKNTLTGAPKSKSTPRKAKRNKQKKAPQKQNNEQILHLLQTLHKPDVYKDFLCYLS